VFEIGNSLREARVRQGLGYPELELATKIRAKYLRALEEEDFDVLPSEAYARGFLRSYAEQLGLDGQLYVDEFGSRFGAALREEQPQRQPRSRARRGVERRAVALALTGIAALVVLVFVAWRFGGSSNPTPSVVPPQRPAGQAELVLRGLDGGAYVQVRRGGPTGRIVLQATIPRGGVERLRGTAFALAVRHSGNLRVSIGGRPVSLPAAKTLRVRIGLNSTTLLGA
jgi:hypothetical protein